VEKMGKARNSRGKTRHLYKRLVWTPQKKKKDNVFCDLLEDEQVELDLK